MKDFSAVGNADKAIKTVMSGIQKFIQKRQRLLSHYKDFSMLKSQIFINEIQDQRCMEVKDSQLDKIHDTNTIEHDNFMPTEIKKASELNYTPQNKQKKGNLNRNNTFGQEKFDQQQRIIDKLQKKYLPISFKNNEEIQEQSFQKFRNIKQIQQKQEKAKLLEQQRLRRKNPIRTINLNQQSVVFEYDGIVKKIDKSKKTHNTPIFSLESHVISKPQENSRQAIKSRLKLIEPITIQNRILISNSQRSFIKETNRLQQDSTLKKKLRQLQNKEELELNINRQSQWQNNIIINQAGIKLTINNNNKVFTNKNVDKKTSSLLNGSIQQKTKTLNKQRYRHLKTSVSDYKDDDNIIQEFSTGEMKKVNRDNKRFRSVQLEKGFRYRRRQRIVTHNESQKDFLIEGVQMDQFQQNQIFNERKESSKPKSLLNRLLSNENRQNLHSSLSQNLQNKSLSKQTSGLNKDIQSKIYRFKVNLKRLIKRDSKLLIQTK